MEWMSEICNRLGCGSIVQRGTWLWDHVIKFAWWQHPAIWHVPLGWHAIQFAQTSAILKFYFRFRPYHRSRYVILHQSAKFYPNRTAHDWKMTSCRFSRWHWQRLDFRDPKMGSLKSPCRTSYRSSIKTIALLLGLTRGQSNLTKSASRGAHSPVRGHPRGSKVVPLNSWGRVSY